MKNASVLTDCRNQDGREISVLDIARNEGVKAALWVPHYLPRSAWLEHIPFAFWLVSQQRPRMIVELGTHYGASYFAFCQAVEMLGLDSRCYAVDSWKGDEHAGFYGEDVYASVRAHSNAFYSRFSTLIRATFADTVQYFDDASIDLLHLDGLHTKDAVNEDLKCWMPKLSERAVLLLHDTNVRERDFGVRNVLRELRDRYPVFEFSHGHGLGVVGIGTKLSTTIVEFLQASTVSPLSRDISSFFARLGQGCSTACAARNIEQKHVDTLAARSSEASVQKHQLVAPETQK